MARTEKPFVESAARIFLRFHQTPNLPHVESAGAENVVQLGIVAHASPIARAFPARKDHRHFVRIGAVCGEGPVVEKIVLLPHVFAERRMLGRQIVEIILRNTHRRERRRLPRKGLRGRCFITGDVRFRHGTLLQAKHGSAVRAVKNKEQSLLAHFRHGRDRLSAALDVEQRRRAGNVPIPQIVVHELLIPNHLCRYSHRARRRCRHIAYCQAGCSRQSPGRQPEELARKPIRVPRRES